MSLQTKLQGDALFVVSNREPYMHVFDEKKQTIQMLVPASGLVTALEPVLQACEGTWVANGSGNADREVVNERDQLRVPPHHPTYTLRRVWLSEEEERGYYEGFLERRAMAALPHRPYAAAIPAGGLDVLPANQPAVRGCGVGGNGRNTIAGASGAGLSLCVAGADGEGNTTGRARRGFLAYSMAECGGVWNLSVAAGTGGRVAGRGSCRISHPDALQQFSADGGPSRRSTDGLGPLRSEPQGAYHAGAAVSDQRGFSLGTCKAAR